MSDLDEIMMLEGMLATKDGEIERLRAERDTLLKRVIMAEGAAEMLDRMDDEGQAEITRLRAELLALAKGGDGRTLAEIQRTENSLRAELEAERERSDHYSDLLFEWRETWNDGDNPDGDLLAETYAAVEGDRDK